MPRLPRQSAAASRATKGTQAHHQTQPCVRSAAPATQNNGGCRQVPRLPRKSAAASQATKGDPSAPPDPSICQKCQDCHAKRQPCVRSATPATENEGGCRHMTPSATPAAQKCRGVTGDQGDPSAPPDPATQNERGCRQVPRLPRKKCCGVTGDQGDPSARPDPSICQKRHACHAKRQPCVRSDTPATQNDRGCRQVPRLPRKSAAASRATKGTQARHQTQPCVRSATPATQNDSHVSEMPRLPRKRTWRSPSATPAAQKCRGVTGDQGDPSMPPDPAMCKKRHACHGKVPKRRWRDVCER